MLCNGCEVLSMREGSRRSASSPGRVWGVERLGNLICAACGAILAPEGVVQRLFQKQSQLAQFGLAGLCRPLLDAARREGH